MLDDDVGLRDGWQGCASRTTGGCRRTREKSPRAASLWVLAQEPDVDLNLGAIEWGVEWEARKHEASRRVVPTVPPLLALLKRAYLEQGRPDGSQLVCPPRYVAKTGVLSAPGLARRARTPWKEAGLRPITLEEARHTAATGLARAWVCPGQCRGREMARGNRR